MVVGGAIRARGRYQGWVVGMMVCSIRIKGRTLVANDSLGQD